MSPLRRHGSTIALVLGLVAAGGYLLATREAVTTGESEVRKSNVLKLFRPDRLSQMHFKRSGDEYRLIRKLDVDGGTEGLWKIERIVDGKPDEPTMADQITVDRMLTALEFLYPQRRIKPEEVDRAAFGLNASPLVLTLVMGGKRTTLTFGGDAPKPEGSIYVDVDGEVSVVKLEALKTLETPTDAFRTRAIVPYLSNDLSSIVLDGEGGKRTFVPRLRLSWRFVDGEQGGARTKRFMFDRMLEAFADTKASSFPSEAEASAAQSGASTVTLTMVPKDSSKARGVLTLGGACPGHPDEVVIVRSSPTRLVACTAKGVYDVLTTPASSFVDHRLLSLREDEIEEIRLDEGEHHLEIARSGDGWKQRQPVEATVENERARALSKAISDLEGDEMVTPGEKVAALLPPRAIVTVSGGAGGDGDGGVAGPEREVIEVGHEEKDGRVPLRRVQDNVIMRVRKDDARALLPRATSLRSLRVIEQPLDRIHQMHVSSDGVTQTLSRNSEGVWSLVEPKGYEIDVSTASDMAQAIARLTAERWAADEDDGTFGLAKPRATIDLTMDPGDAGTKQFKLLLGGPAQGGLYAKLDGEKGVFVVPRSIETNVLAWAIERGSCAIQPGDIESVTLTKGKSSLTLTSDRGEFKLPENAARELSTQRLEAIAEALRNLLAEGVVHLGAARREEGLDHPVLELRARRREGRGEIHVVIGAGDVYRSVSVFYARRDGVDAVFALPAARVRTLLDALLGHLYSETPYVTKGLPCASLSPCFDTRVVRSCCLCQRRWRCSKNQRWLRQRGRVGSSGE